MGLVRRQSFDGNTPLQIVPGYGTGAGALIRRTLMSKELVLIQRKILAANKKEANALIILKKQLEEHPKEVCA